MARKRDDPSRIPVVDTAILIERFRNELSSRSLLQTLPDLSNNAQNTLLARLPYLCARYSRARIHDAKTGSGARRRQLDRLAKRAKQLREELSELESSSRLDLLTSLSSLTGATFTVDPNRPDTWVSDIALRTIRDLGVAAAKSSRQLKRSSRRGGRPKHTAERLLIWDLAELYRHCTNRMPGRRGHFPKFVVAAFEIVDPMRVNEGLDDLIREIVADFKKEFAEKD